MEDLTVSSKIRYQVKAPKHGRLNYMTSQLVFSLVAAATTIVTALGQQVSTDAKAAATPRAAQIDRNGALTLIRTAIIALQQANQTNDYRVLYAMSAPGFQKFTPVEKLAENFTGLRNSKLDLSGVAVLDPQFTVLPQTDGSGIMRMAGYFPSAPMQINFDLQFTPIDNRWRLLGITVTVSPSAPIAPSSPTATPKATPSPSPAKAKKK